MELKKVMIVEDNLLLSIVEERMVKKLGFEVVGKAMSGEEALAKINKVRPEILIMDIQLAGTLDGIETVQQIRKDKNDIPVVFLSGNNDSNLLEKAKKLNCIDFLIKPVTASILLEPLERASEMSDKKSPHAA